MIKQAVITGTAIAMLSIQPYLPISEARESVPSPALYGEVLAPYVSLQHSDKFMQPILCKTENEKAPIVEQLKQCKKQRVGWLKI
jgi:hypothetical protein